MACRHKLCHGPSSNPPLLSVCHRLSSQAIPPSQIHNHNHTLNPILFSHVPSRREGFSKRFPVQRGVFMSSSHQSKPYIARFVSPALLTDFVSSQLTSTPQIPQR